MASRHSQHLRDIFGAGPPLVSAPEIWPLIGCHLLALGVCRQPQGVIVRGQGGGGAGVPRLRAGAQRCGEVQPEINRVTNLIKIISNKNTFIETLADLLRGALRQLEEMLVVGEDVVQGGVLLLAGCLPPHQAPGLLGLKQIDGILCHGEMCDFCDLSAAFICHL